MSPDDVSTRSPLLEVRGLTVGYRTGEEHVALVCDASFSVRPGEIVALVGESGSGKTLTARAVMGLLRNNERMSVRGEVDFAGADLTRASARELRTMRGAQLSMIFQDPVAALDPVFTVGHQIAEAVERRRGANKEVRRRVLELLGLVGISDPERRARQFPHELSGGMCQRVAIAIALAGGPRLLIADEPTTALDVTVQAQVLDQLKRLRDEHELSVLLITHDMGVAAQTADRLLVMYAGSIVEEGETGEFFARPLHPYSAGLIAAVPRVDDERRARLATIPGSVPEARDRPGGCPFHPRCPYALEACATTTPLLEPLSGRLVACHRALEIRSGALSLPPAHDPAPAVAIGLAR